MSNVAAAALGCRELMSSNTTRQSHHSPRSRSSLPCRSRSGDTVRMDSEPDRNVTPPAAPDDERIADILRRVARGDPSVTDEVFWLQMHEDFVTGKNK